MPELGEPRAATPRRRPWAGRGRRGSRRASRSLLVRRRRGGSSARGPGRDGDHPAARGELLVERGRGSGGTSRQRASTASGAPLTTSAGSRPGRRTSADVIWRSWSNGSDPEPSVRGDRRGARRPGAAHSAVSSGVAADRHCRRRVASVASRPSSSARSRGGPPGSSAARKRDPALGEGAGLVGDQDVDVAEVLDADQPFDQHLAAGEPRGSRWRGCVLTTAGQQLRGDADGDGQARTAPTSSSGRCSSRLVTKISAVSTTATCSRSSGEAAQPGLERRSPAGARPSPSGDPAELRPRRRWRPRPRAGCPRCTTVPISAQQVRSASAVPGGDRRRRPWRPASDSPVSTLSSHSSPVGLQQPEVGRDDLAELQPHDVARARGR